jgi:hypothetical protein
MSIVATGCDNFLEEDYIDVDEIWYTTTDGQIVELCQPVFESHFGAKMLSNNYYGSHGIIEFDDEVTRIGSAFIWCKNLKSIILPNSVTHISAYAFEKCHSLTSINIPDGVTAIYAGTFKFCSSLESVSLGNGVTGIGGYAFHCCGSLKSVDIPDNVTFIGDSAFEECRKLETVTLGSGVTKIGWRAFFYCSSLKSVYCKATTPPLLEVMSGFEQVFRSSASKCKFYVPTKSVSAYKSAEGWKEYADNIVGYDF